MSAWLLILHLMFFKSTISLSNPIPVKVCKVDYWYTYLWHDEQHLLVVPTKSSKRERQFYFPERLFVAPPVVVTLPSMKQRKLPALVKLWKRFGEANPSHIVDWLFTLRRGQLACLVYPQRGGVGNHNIVILYDLETDEYLRASLALSEAEFLWWDSTATYVIGIEYTEESPKALTVDFHGEDLWTTNLPKDTPPFIGLAPNGVAVGVEKHKMEDRAEITVANFTLTSDTKITRKKLAPLPLAFQRFESILSPNGERILWIFKNKLDKERQEILVWVSDSKGEGMHSIATYISTLKRSQKEVSPYPKIRCFQWLPDSRSISFIQEDTLYKIPVL